MGRMRTSYIDNQSRWYREFLSPSDRRAAAGLAGIVLVLWAGMLLLEFAVRVPALWAARAALAKSLTTWPMGLRTAVIVFGGARLPIIVVLAWRIVLRPERIVRGLIVIAGVDFAWVVLAAMTDVVAFGEVYPGWTMRMSLMLPCAAVGAWYFLAARVATAGAITRKRGDACSTWLVVSCCVALICQVAIVEADALTYAITWALAWKTPSGLSTLPIVRSVALLAIMIATPWWCVAVSVGRGGAWPAAIGVLVGGVLWLTVEAWSKIPTMPGLSYARYLMEPVLFLVISTALLVYRRFRRDVPIDECAVCVGCGYLVDRVAGPNCPECGRVRAALRNESE